MTVNEYAKSKGYDRAEFRREWRGYKVFEPLWDDDEVHYVGYPYKIMVKDGKARMQTFDECLAYMDECADLDAKEYYSNKK